MKLLTWNVRGAFPPYTPHERIEDQIRYLEETAGRPDVLALNEVSRYRRDVWVERLQAIGYSELAHTLDWAEELGESDVPPHQDYSHVNGNLTAVHERFTATGLTRLHPSVRKGPWDGSDLKDWDTNVPEKILRTEVELEESTLDLWNVRAVPGSLHGEEKIKALENVYSRIVKGSEPPCILAGDFNAPDRELADGTIVPSRHDQGGAVASRWNEAESNVLSGLADEGMVDVFRDQHGYGDLDVLDVSYATGTDDPTAVPPEDVEGKRFDHVIASTELRPRECFYDQAGFACSDHAPMIAEFGF